MPERKRLGPAEHAGEHRWKVKQGLDGNEWVSRPDKNNVYRWRRVLPGRSAARAVAQVTPRPPSVKYDQREFLTTWRAMARDLRRQDVYAYAMKWKDTYDIFSYAWADAVEQAMIDAGLPRLAARRRPARVKFLDDHAVMVVTEWDLYNAATSKGRMSITFSPGTSQKAIREAVQKHFGDRASLKRFGKGTIEVQMKKS